MTPVVAVLPAHDRILSAITTDQAQRFWDRLKVAPSGCWEFTGRAQVRGYGVVSIGRAPLRRTALTHRIAWALTNGAIPEGMFVCHHCDNPPCCNPAHLFVGTNRDNVRDAVAKGRNSKPPTGSGEKNNFAKLTAEGVEAIRRDFVREYERGANGQWRTNARELGLQYGVTGANVLMIMRGVTWN